MVIGKHLSVPNVSDDFMKTADVLLLLDSGAAILCHSQILCLHSAVLRNMLADLVASQRTTKRLRIPLADFTEAQCSALLAYFYNCGVSGKGTLLDYDDSANYSAAVAVARFAHKYDAPHALRHAEAHLAVMVEVWKSRAERSAQQLAGLTDQDVVDLAVMADKFDMHKLCGACERAMMVQWGTFAGYDQVMQLSVGALKRIATGLHMTLQASLEPEERAYPAERDMVAWRQQGDSAKRCVTARRLLTAVIAQSWIRALVCSHYHKWLDIWRCLHDSELGVRDCRARI